MLTTRWSRTRDLVQTPFRSSCLGWSDYCPQCLPIANFRRVVGDSQTRDGCLIPWRNHTAMRDTTRTKHRREAVVVSFRFQRRRLSTSHHHLPRQALAQISDLIHILGGRQIRTPADREETHKSTHIEARSAAQRYQPAAGRLWYRTISHAHLVLRNLLETKTTTLQQGHLKSLERLNIRGSML